MAALAWLSSLAMGLAVLIAGFLLFAYIAKGIVRPMVDEHPAVRMAVVLIMGLSDLPRLSAKEFDARAREVWHPILGAIRHGGKLFSDGMNLPIHPVVVSQLDAAFELPLKISTDTDMKAVERYCAESHKKNELVEMLRRPPRFPWQQNLRVLAFHLGTTGKHQRTKLKKIVVITTDKSAKDYPLFEALVHKKLREFGGEDVCISQAACPVDAEKFNDVHALLNEEIKALRSASEGGEDFADRDIVIDITALPRPFAIAASVLTLNRDLVFSYVNNNGELSEYDGDIAFPRSR